MARRAADKKTSPAKTPAPKSRKPRVANVRGLIIQSLGKGSQSRAALLKATGASYNGLVLHLSKLKAEGIVTLDASNRIVSLADTGLVAKKRGSAKASPKATAALEASQVIHPLSPLETPSGRMPVGYSSDALREALAHVLGRITPVDRLDEKQLVLEQLARQIGGPIAVVLNAIKVDLEQRSAV